MASALPRGLLKWVLGLNLSLPIKNVRRDLANGFLVAEIVSRYLPEDIQMHSFENVTSMQRKKAQWQLLEKVFKKHRAPVTRVLIDSVMAAEVGAAEDMLETLSAWLTGPCLRQPEPQRVEPAGPSGASQVPRQEQMAVRSPEDYRQPPADHYGHAQADVYARQRGYVYQGYGQPVSPGGQHAFVFGNGQPPHTAETDESGASYAAAYPAAAEHILPQRQGQRAAAPSCPSEPAGQQPLQWNLQQGYQAQPERVQQSNGYIQEQQQQQLTFDIQAHPAEAQAYYAQYYEQCGYPADAASAYAAQYVAQLVAHQQAYGQQGYGAQALATGHQADQPQGGPSPEKERRQVDYTPYTLADYKSKQNDKYWELGKMQPDLETDEMREKREKAEKVKAYAKGAHLKNMNSPTVTKSKPRMAVKEPTARERALKFAKNVPKPEPKKRRDLEEDGGRSQGGSAAPKSELELLEEQHRLDQQRIEAMRQELGGLGI